MLAQIVLFDGFDPLDVIAPYEVLHLGGELTGGELTVELASAEGAREVPSGTGSLALRATAPLEPERAELTLVPGAAGTSESIPVILGRTLATAGPVGLCSPTPQAGSGAQPLTALLGRALARPGSTVATVCGGSLLLAMAGLITGRHATTHHLGLAALAACGVTAIDARVVDDGDLVTGGSVTSGLDLALYLLERELGPQVAHAVEGYFRYERRGTVWHRTGLVPAAP